MQPAFNLTLQPQPPYHMHALCIHILQHVKAHVKDPSPVLIFKPLPQQAVHAPHLLVCWQRLSRVRGRGMHVWRLYGQSGRQHHVSTPTLTMPLMKLKNRFAFELHDSPLPLFCPLFRSLLNVRMLPKTDPSYAQGVHVKTAALRS